MQYLWVIIFCMFVHAVGMCGSQARKSPRVAGSGWMLLVSALDAFDGFLTALLGIGLQACSVNKLLCFRKPKWDEY